MQVPVNQLAQHLRQPLAPIFTLSGDEPLQLNEACDAVRQAAREQDYSSREVYEANAQFDWGNLSASANALSLFAEKKLIELRIPSAKPGRDGSLALLDYCAHPAPDTCLLVILPGLKKDQLKSKWMSALNQKSIAVTVYPIELAQLPRWVEQRMRAVGLQPDDEAVRLLAERVEGNLLAAHQEIEKLALLHGKGPVNAEQLAASVANSARYDVFELADAALGAELARSLRILGGLQGEGVAATLVLWALHRDIALLAEIAVQISQGRDSEQALNRREIWSKRKPLFRNALRRQPVTHWLKLLKACQHADVCIKGAVADDPWRQLERLCLEMARA